MRKKNILLTICSTFLLIGCTGDNTPVSSNSSNQSSANSSISSVGESSIAPSSSATSVSSALASSENSSANSSYVSSNSSVVSEVVKPALPTSLDEVQPLLENSKNISKMNWSDTRDSSSGEAKFYDKEVLENVKKGSGANQEESLLYRGYDNSMYYEIDTASFSAKKYSIVETVSNSSVEKTMEEVKRLTTSYSHNVDWFLNKAKETYSTSSLVAEKTVTSIDYTDSNGFVVKVNSVTTGTRTYETIYEFNNLSQLISGSFKSYNYDADSFNKETHELIDENAVPNEKNEIFVSFVPGERLTSGESKAIDIDKYYISELLDVFVSSYTDEENHKNQVEVGSSISIYMDGQYAPATALDKSSYSIVNSSNPTVIGKKGNSSYYSALNEGTATLTISNPFNTVSKSITVIVTKPAVTALYVNAAKKELNINETTTLNVELYPEGANQEVSAVSSDSTVVEVTSISTDYKTINVKALKEGTATIEVTSVSNPNIKKSVTITVKTPAPVSDLSWLIGEWEDSQNNAMLVFNEDKTGSLKQRSSSTSDYNNVETFTWSYKNDVLEFDTWTGDYYYFPANPSLNAEKTTMNVDLDDGIYLVSCAFVKLASTTIVDDYSWLVGDWNDDDNACKLTFNADKTGSYSEISYSSMREKATFNWSFENEKLTITNWDETYYSILGQISLNAQKTEIKLNLEDDYEYYYFTFVKA